jgi:uncharacterized protein DUF6193
VTPCHPVLDLILEFLPLQNLFSLLKKNNIRKPILMNAIGGNYAPPTRQPQTSSAGMEFSKHDYNGHVIRSKRKWSDFPPDPYPEIGFERTVGRLILEIIESSGRRATINNGSQQVYSAYLQRGRRTVSVQLGCDRRLFMLSFTDIGLTLAYLHTADLHEVARAVESWLTDKVTLRDMKERLPKLEASEFAYETDAGKGVTARWNAMLSAPWFKPEFVALLRAAERRPLLRQLVPVVSIGQYLSFSRTIGYPFSTIKNRAVWAGKDRYCALGPQQTIIKEGTVEEVLDIVEGSVPSDAGPAIYGTADDLSP